MKVTETRPATTGITWRHLWPVPLGAAILLAALFGFFAGRLTVPGEQSLPVFRAAPAYALTDQWGHPVASRNFGGKVQIVTFLFPYCTTMCPLIAAHLANFENMGARPAGIADQVQIVSFNLDPAGTGPKQMREFMRQYGWQPDNTHWEFLTGSPAAIRRIVRNGFAVYYERVPLSAETEGESGGLPVVQPEIVNKIAEAAHPAYDIVHDDVIEIVDRQGRIRKVFEDADTVGWQQMLDTVEDLIAHPA